MFSKAVFLSMLLSIFLLASEEKPLDHSIICVGTSSEVESMCKDLKNTQYIVLNDTNNTKYEEEIYTIQEALRVYINKSIQAKQIPSIVLYAKGFSATLAAIAQTNILPYYRHYIQGIMLYDVPPNILKLCNFKKKPDTLSNVCQNILTMPPRMKSNPSLHELAKSLSINLQMDWYWPKVLLLSSKKTKLTKTWAQAFEANSIVFKKTSYARQNIDTFIYSLPYSKKQNIKIPKYTGPILRFHLSKIHYKSKKPITVWHNLYYGKSKQQTYNVYFSKEQKNAPLIIYVHGGGWTQGDKNHYDSFCRQYVDKGYTAIALNYRLLKLPSVSMQDMVKDIQRGIRKVLKNTSKYQANPKKVVIIGESAGAQLLFLALSKLDKNLIQVAILNSITADLHKHSKEKQKRLSGIEGKKARNEWVNTHSPLSNLHSYYTPTLSFHGLDDQVVPASHLKELDLKSVIYQKNIFPVWVINSEHPLSPSQKAMHPSYLDMEEKIDSFIKSHI